ncbi:M66 family metalloprotease [Sanguibacter gelidistatuariae]|uniref:M66 family metalloprotease n=1 Tax=Sanguibacter gelidistatuariae TaxID=1814289 RepID=UPI0011146509|nr:M66 family metalloprotease [Sanguibacter gelidistatuariae]
MGFFDTTATGAARALRNDLSGALSGQVQFAQSHTIDASGNTAKKMPTLVTSREALLLFSPEKVANSVSVEVSINGVVINTIALADPTQIPRSDMVITGTREDVVYTRKAWTTTLPYDVMKSGLSLKFTTDTRETGVLAADKFEFAAPKELIISSIELGMLTAAPTSTDHYMLNEPEKAGSDYFQTVPVAKMIVAKYETVSLDKVIVSTADKAGKIYTDASADTGGVYAGDMRENVGKAQVSTGINQANFGTSSSPMDQKQPGTFNERIIHHSAGLYVNGVQKHGLSGGNGMATLYSSWGNEFSHELGHSYGLGHYPGVNNALTGDAKVINATQNSESGWGYIAYRDRMRSNLAGGSAFLPAGFDVNGDPFAQNYQGIYNYNRDSMAGGWVTSTLSKYTHYTGYSADIIQRGLKTVVPDLAYPSGYRDWDAANGKYVDAKVLNQAFSSPKPSKVGVPVFTLLGGYNPSNEANTLMYPAFRSNYGNVFTPAAGAVDTSTVSSTRQCWISVTFADAHVENTALLATDGVKQFNINIADADKPTDKPTDASINCRTGGVTTQLGNAITIATDLAPMAPAVVIGEEQGYKALRAVEIVELDASLQKLVGSAVPVLPTTAALQLSSWESDLTGLSASSLAVLERIRLQQAAADAVETFVATNKTALAAGDSAVKAGLVDVLTANGMTESDSVVLPKGAALTIDNGRCLTVDDISGTHSVVATATSKLCADGDEQRWVMDVRGAIHNVALPGLCLTAATPATLTKCSTATASQVWTWESDGHLKSATSSYLDLYKHLTPSTPGMYPRTTGANQIWKGLTTSSNPVLVTLSPATLALLRSLRLDVVA